MNKLKNIPPIAWVIGIICAVGVFLIVIRFGNIDIGIGENKHFSIKTTTSDEVSQIKELLNVLKDINLVSTKTAEKNSIPSLPFPDLSKNVMHDQINIIYLLLLDIYNSSKNNPKLNFIAEHMLQDLLNATEFIKNNQTQKEDTQ